MRLYSPITVFAHWFGGRCEIWPAAARKLVACDADCRWPMTWWLCWLIAVLLLIREYILRISLLYAYFVQRIQHFTITNNTPTLVCVNRSNNIVQLIHVSWFHKNSELLVMTTHNWLRTIMDRCARPLYFEFLLSTEWAFLVIIANSLASAFHTLGCKKCSTGTSFERSPHRA
jgi:hypothetical protein